jgi:hypothetical protein
MLLGHLFGLLLLSQASAEKDPSKVGQKHGCTADGRYWVHADKGKKVFCWEGAGYNEDHAPPFVKGYFEEASSDTTAAPQTTLPDVVLNPVGSAPVSKQSSSSSSGGGGGGGGGAAPKFSVGGGGGAGVLSGGAASSGGAKVKDALRDLARDPSPSASGAGGRREPDPINAALLGEIENGMDRATVVARLGEPHGKILNTGDEGALEIWTYVVRGGAFASVRMENNKVIKVVKPR